MKKLFESGRPNKLANGIYLNDKRHERKGKIRISNNNHPLFNKKGNYFDILSLNVRGTTDILGRGNWVLIKRVLKEHPTDKGYFKEVYILSKEGRNKLKRLKSC